jgi:hypothetical protein
MITKHNNLIAYHETDSHLYLMKCNRTGFYKIGKSKNPKHREKTLQSESPSIQMIAVFNGQGWQERDWHIHFAKCRVRGEWFDLTKIQVAFMCQELLKTPNKEAENARGIDLKKKARLLKIQSKLNKIAAASQEYNATEYDKEDHENILRKIRSKYQIPYGVHLMGECAINHSDIPVFMQFADLWMDGAMTNELMDVFIFHFCEVVEVDFFWVLMDKPSFYYCNTWKEYKGEPTYADMEEDFRKIGTMSQDKRELGFKLGFHHGFA